MSITYQQAKRVRKTGWLNLLADQLMYEKKVSTAISRTISLKTRGNIMGITQYMDPLNIARMMTFGSSIGPALLGHWMGRDARDIQYFAKRYKPIHERKRTGDRLTKLGGQGGDIGGSSTAVLQKIYKLMANSYERDKQRLELAKNREEEISLEEEKRNKELLEAIKSRPTASLISVDSGKDESWFNKLFDGLKGVIASAMTVASSLSGPVISGLMKWVAGHVSSAVSGLSAVVGGLGSVLMFVIRRTATSLLRAIINPALAATLFVQFQKASENTKYHLMGLVESKQKEINETMKGISNIEEKLSLSDADYHKKYHDSNLNWRNINEKKLLSMKDILEKQIQERDTYITRIQNKPWEENTLEGAMESQASQAIESLTGFSLFDQYAKFKESEKLLGNTDQYMSTPTIDLKTGQISGGFRMEDFLKNMADIGHKVEVDKIASSRERAGNVTSGKLQKLEPKVTTPANSVEKPTNENKDTKLKAKISSAVPTVQNNTKMLSSNDKIPMKRIIPSVRNNEEEYVAAVAMNLRIMM